VTLDEESTAPTVHAAPAYAEPSTSYWRGPQAVANVRSPDEVSTVYVRPGAAGAAVTAVRQPDVEPATSTWQQGRAQAQAQAPTKASPRAETYLSAARGGVGRPAAAVAMTAAPSRREPMHDPSRGAGASSRRLRPLPQPVRAPSHLPADPAWSDEAERTVARSEGHDARASTAAGSAPRRLPEPPSSSIAAPSSEPRTSGTSSSADEPRSRAAPSAPSTSSAPSPPAGPLRIEAPPEVALAAYPLVRRIALQQDLKAADRVLRVGLSELANATTCRTWFIGIDTELFSLELSAETSPEEKALLDQSLAASQPRAAGRMLVIPVVAAGRVVALAMLVRTEAQPAFAPTDLMISMVVMQETAGFLVQLLLHHAEAQRDLAADARSIYNPEALASQRKRGHEGGLVHLSPRWVRIAYPSAVIAVLIAIAFALLAKVPTYSAGAGVITIEGIEITSPSPGSVATVHVQPGQPVRAGEELARLLAQDEESALVQADREYRNALATLLFDGADETTKAAVAAAASNRQRATDRLEARVIRAPQDGVVGDIRVRSGAALGQGDHVLTLLRQDAEPTVLVFLPGQDRPRLRRGQAIQIELAGYTKVREKGTILEVGAEVIGPNEARRALGQKNADAVPLNGPVVMVRATLPSRTFKVARDTFRYHDGMPLRGEVKVDNKPFLISLIPALEKAL
jgi:biotin carboxyl carrier protein